MRLEIIAKRISDKTDCPEIYEIILGKTDKSTLPDKCLVWTGKRRRQKPIIRMHRDWNMMPFMAPSVQPPRAIMRHNKKDVYVHRFLIELINQPSGHFIATSGCGTAFCVNPNHWLVSPAPGTAFPPEDDPNEGRGGRAATDAEGQKDANEFVEDPWPEDEVERMIDYYLCVNNSQLDPNHDLLVDIPLVQLKRVAEKMGQGHRLSEDLQR